MESRYNASKRTHACKQMHLKRTWKIVSQGPDFRKRSKSREAIGLQRQDRRRLAWLDPSQREMAFLPRAWFSEGVQCKVAEWKEVCSIFTISDSFYLQMSQQHYGIKFLINDIYCFTESKVTYLIPGFFYGASGLLLKTSAFSPQLEMLI